jgi:hypothetical protein
MLDLLTGQERKRTGREVEVFIQVYQVHLEDGPRRLQDNGAAWRPETGLGVWSHEPPPHFYTGDEFENLDVGEQPRTLMNYLFRVAGDADHARRTMLGLGTLLQTMSIDGKAFVAGATERLKAPITDVSFTAFPFYIPLLRGDWITGATSAQLDEWTCGADLYIRESREDRGVLILAREPLQPIIEAAFITPDRQT